MKEEESDSDFDDEPLVPTSTSTTAQGVKRKRKEESDSDFDDTPLVPCKKPNGGGSKVAVRKVIEGRPVYNRDALSNPEALDLYKNIPELSTE